jgi:hypothetical protein
LSGALWIRHRLEPLKKKKGMGWKTERGRGEQHCMVFKAKPLNDQAGSGWQEGCQGHFNWGIVLQVLRETEKWD